MSSSPDFSEVRVHFVQLHVFTVLVSCCDVRNNFPVKTIFGSSFITSICFVGGSCFIYVICTNLLILASNAIFTSEDAHVRWLLQVEQELLNLPEHPSSFIHNILLKSVHLLVKQIHYLNIVNIIHLFVFLVSIYMFQITRVYS